MNLRPPRPGAATAAGSPGRTRRFRAARHRGLVRIGPVFATVTAASGCVIGMAQPSSGASKFNIPSETMCSGSTLTLRSQMVKAFEASHAGITVMATNIPSATGDAKLQSEITARDPPDVFSEWSPVHGEYAANGLIPPKNPYRKATYANFAKWEHPIARQGGVYKGNLYAIPMSMNSWALYHNKGIMKAAGITR